MYSKSHFSYIGSIDAALLLARDHSQDLLGKGYYDAAGYCQEPVGPLARIVGLE